jgi:hypothetical protein
MIVSTLCRPRPAQQRHDHGKALSSVARPTATAIQQASADGDRDPQASADRDRDPQEGRPGEPG